MMRLGYNAPANSAVEASRPRSLCPARSTTASFPGERHPLRYLPYQFDRRLILVPATESTIRPCRPFGNAGRKLQLVAILALLIDTIETKSAGMPVERQRPETSGAPAPRDEMHSSADDRLARLDSAVATASPARGNDGAGTMAGAFAVGAAMSPSSKLPLSGATRLSSSFVRCRSFLPSTSSTPIGRRNCKPSNRIFPRQSLWSTAWSRRRWTISVS
jgi:hypothetical protein